MEFYQGVSLLRVVLGGEVGGKRLQEISLKIGGWDGGKYSVWILAIKIVAGI